MIRLTACLLALAAAAPAAAERTFGLVIGIDDYAFIPDLHGAVNDARDIADALEGLGADVTLLLDGDATRAAVIDGWTSILDKATPGDRLVVSYAGHGSNEPEHLAGSEADGRDENFLLAGFAPRGAAAGERLRDDEIADLLAKSAALEVIFVADACHSGTVTRNLNPVLGYRYVTPDEMSSDPLPPPPPPSKSEGRDQVALFLAAVNEAEKVPEFLIDGAPRGALSYAFASGLRGGADFNRDGQLTKGELEAHVRRTVRVVSDGAQLPQSAPVGQETRALVTIGTPAPAQPTAKLTDKTFAALAPVAVAGDRWTGVTGVAIAPQPALRLDGVTVYSAVGDPVAVAPDSRTLQAVADKTRLVQALTGLALPPLNVSFAGGDRSYGMGEHLEILVNRRQTPHLTLFNLGSDGTISFLYPVASLGDPLITKPGDKVRLPVRIEPPFGADHVVAIEGMTEATILHAGLARLDGGRDMAALWDLIRHSGGRVALFPFFSREDA